MTIINMNSPLVMRIVSYLDNITENRPVSLSLGPLREVVTIYHQFHGKDDKEIVRHFHKQGKKIDGIKTIRLMTGAGLSDTKALYERLCVEIDNELPKVDVNHLKELLTYTVANLPTPHNNNEAADFQYLLNQFDTPEPARRSVRFYTDSELVAKGIDPMTRWLYSTARDHYFARLRP